MDEHEDENLDKGQGSQKYDEKREELKIKKLESRLEVLKSLNGKSYKLWAITIMRFDLGVKFSKEDYNKFAQEVRVSEIRL